MRPDGMTRGESNKNPGNIERNYVKWQGMSSDQSADVRFVVFNTPHDGIRALAKLLLTYFNKYRHNTVQAIISRWAPQVENNTNAYVNHVSKALGVEPDSKIVLTNPDTLERIVTAIIVHENGRCLYDDATIVKAVDSALA
jgi:hypothetical protein